MDDDFAPPPGFDGWSIGEWGDRNYERACTPEEAALLDADRAAAEQEERADGKNLRDAWFRLLREEIEAARLPAPQADGS
jgi:hypothetical protein